VRESKIAPERARENQAGKTRNGTGRGKEVRRWGERGEGKSGKREMYSRCACARVCT